VNLERAFLEDVIAHPDDDAPRLVYADWLDDRGDSDRAEFIRTQCELARGGVAAPRRAELLAREEALLREHGQRWAAPLRGDVDEWAFRRGFIENIAVHTPDGMSHPFFDRIEEVFSFTPVRALRLMAVEFVPSPLLTAEDCLARLHSLDLLLTTHSDGALRSLFTSPGLRNLTSLLVEIELAERTTLATLKALGAAPALGGLTEFGLLIGDDTRHLRNLVVEALVRSPSLTNVTRLYLPQACVWRASARALTLAPRGAPLTHLDLRRAEIELEALREFERTPNLAALQRLDVRGAEIVIGDEYRPLSGDEALGRLLANLGEEVVAHGEGPARCRLPRWQGWAWQ
jgi:uncharacterized protein (TIGR02996 family)